MSALEQVRNSEAPTQLELAVMYFGDEQTCDEEQLADAEIAAQEYLSMSMRIAEFEETNPYEFGWMKKHNDEVAALQARVAELEKYMFAFFDLMDGNDASDIHHQTGFSREYCENISSLFNSASKEDKVAWSKRTNS